MKRLPQPLGQGRRPARAEMGRRQASASSEPASLLPTNICPLRRALRRQRRRLPRPGQQRAHEGHEVRLSDINADIIGCYRAIRDRVEEVVAALWVLDAGHRARPENISTRCATLRFNPARRAVHAGSHPEAAYLPELAAMLIYLNRTGYNGLFRLNSHGEFNVPAGRYGSVRICDPDNLRGLAAALGEPGTSIEVEPFDRALASAGPADFVYLDPPYAPVSRTANFTSYTSAGFGLEQQAVLQRRVIELAGRGAHVLLSNSCAPDISALYEENAAARHAGLRTRTVEARRAINSRASSRGPVLEYSDHECAPRGGVTPQPGCTRRPRG